ncbi:MAG: hypothetical protein ACI94D_001163, partial [Neolewinella sp.]
VKTHQIKKHVLFNSRPIGVLNLHLLFLNVLWAMVKGGYNKHGKVLR